jgi:hypothetical protein
VDLKQYAQAAQCYVQAIRYCPEVGLQVSWGQFQNPFYRFIRPYAVAVVYGLFALIRRRAIA